MSDKHSTKSILLHAATLQDPVDRQQFLQSTCGADTERLARIVAWLEREREREHPSSPLDVVIGQLHSTRILTAKADSEVDRTPAEGEREPSPEDLCSHRIDNYELIELLGQGGMGAVYLARQTFPIHRDVALKLINLSGSSPQLIAHFEAERRTLELMNHPGIASVLDAGTTAWGAPYLVMELVNGQPITDYCDEHALSLRERLKLFVDVCLAVQHAHHKGIVHRDLKPGNVLVTCHDQKPLVKVIDFGIARAVDRAADEAALSKRHFLMTGTPLYMSPEQTRMSSEVPDTRSDVYSLGALLYELLAGSTPFDSSRFRELDAEELSRVIREETPPRPSSRLSDAGSSDHRQLRFELDWIIMKAIAKLPGERYQTPGAFAEDVQRFLDGKAILAHPYDWRYRITKWLTAHKAAVATTAVIACSMLVATVVSLINARDARQARDISQALLFAADMKIASEALRDANIRPARERLERHIPRPGEFDRRNFAWHYLWNQLNPETNILQTEDHLFEIRFSPDGELFATGHESGEVLIWRVGANEPVHRLEKHADIVRCIAFSPDENFLATGSDDGEVRLWTLGQSTTKIRWKAHTDDVFGIVWLDQDRFATAGDREVKIWSASSFQVDFSRLERNSTEPSVEIQPLQTFGPFPDLVYAIAISPDGKELAVASRNFAVGGSGLISRWDTQTGREKSNHPLAVVPICVAYHPTENLLAVGTQPGAIYTIQPDSSGGLTVHKVEPVSHSSNVYRVSFSTDGAQMVSASKDATLRIWNTEDWSCERTIQSHLRRVYAVDFRPRSRTFASASADGTIRFFDSNRSGFQQSGLQIPLEQRHSHSIDALPHYLKRPPENAGYVYSQNSFVLSGTSWDNGFSSLETGEFKSLPFPSTQRIAISNNERHLTASLLDSLIVASSTTTVRAKQEQIAFMDLDGDGTADRVGGFGSDGRLVWQRGLSTDPARFLPPQLYGFRPRTVLTRVAEFNAGDWSDVYSLYAGWGQLKRERISGENLIEIEILQEQLPTNSIWQMIETSEGHPPSHLLALPGQGTVYCISGVPGEDWTEVRTDFNRINAVHGFSSVGSVSIDCIVLADDARRLHVFRRQAPATNVKLSKSLTEFECVQVLKTPIDIWELDITRIENGQTILHAAGTQGIFSYSFVDDRLVDKPVPSESIAGSAWAKPLSLGLVTYRMESRQITGAFHSPEHHVWALAISDDGEMVASAGDGEFIRIWNRDGTLINSLKVPRNAKHSMAFNAKSDRLSVGVGDDIYIYDVQRFRLLHQCKGHENSVVCLAISPIKEFLATASNDLTVRLWSLRTGRQLAVLVGHTSKPTCLAFDHDERLLATADKGGIIKLWDIETGGEILELQDFKLPAQCLAFDSPTSLSVIGWSESQTSSPVGQIGRWSILNNSPNPEGLVSY